VVPDQSPTKAGLTLQPNQKARYDVQEHELIKEEADPALQIGWRKGSLVFENEPLAEAIRQLERWYDKTIHLPKGTSLNCRITATIEEESVEEVLALLKSTIRLNYRIKGPDIYLEGSCE
jgi:transmembrane sensor